MLLARLARHVPPQPPRPLPRQLAHQLPRRLAALEARPVSRRLFVRSIAIALAFGLGLGACNSATSNGSAGRSGTSSDDSGPGTELTVLAASSFSDVFRDLAAAFEAAHPDVRVTLSFDASSALRAQIEAGAKADVFVSADVENAMRLAREGLVAGGPLTFAHNDLALVVPAKNPARIGAVTDLAKKGVRIVAAGPDVPITKYASALIANLQAQPGAPADLSTAIARNVVSREDNVRAVLAKVELGEADAGFVYATDARGDGRVKVVPLPAGTNVVVESSAVALSASDDPGTSDQFLRWLVAPDAQAILADRGFLPIQR